MQGWHHHNGTDGRGSFTPTRLWRLATSRVSVHSAFSLDKHPLTPQRPSVLRGSISPELPPPCPSAPRPHEVKEGPPNPKSTCHHVATSLGCLKSCPSLLQVYADRPVARDESVFIVKASLRTRSETQTQRRHLQGRAARWTHSVAAVWLPEPTMEKEKGRSFLCSVCKGIGLLPHALFFRP